LAHLGCGARCLERGRVEISEAGRSSTSRPNGSRTQEEKSLHALAPLRCSAFEFRTSHHTFPIRIPRTFCPRQARVGCTIWPSRGAAKRTQTRPQRRTGRASWRELGWPWGVRPRGGGVECGGLWTPSLMWPLGRTQGKFRERTTRFLNPVWFIQCGSGSAFRKSWGPVGHWEVQSLLLAV